MTPLEAVLDLCTAVHVAALMAWFGALALRRVIGAGQGVGEWRYLQAVAAVALASGALWPWLQAAFLSDDASQAWDPPSVAALLTDSSFGRTWLLRECAIVLAFLASCAPLLAIGRGVLLLVAAALGSMGLLGHAATATGQQITQAVHLLAAGAWLGALPVLIVLCGRLAPGALARVLQRFSSYAITLVALVLASGTLSAVWRLGDWQALGGSNYGRLLLGKVALVALMGVLALRNRNRLTPRLLAQGADTAPHARRDLRHTIAAESALGAAVVLVAVLLGAAEPPQ